MASKGASFVISADTSPYEEAMQRAIQATAQATEAIKQQFEGVNSTFESMKGIFQSAVAVLAGGELASKLNEIAERAAGIRETAETFNLSTEALQGMEVMANQAGVSSDKLQRAMATLEQKMRSAGDEGGKAAEEFNRLGITTEQLQDPAFTVQEAFEKLGASSNSNAALIELLGARGAQLIPVLREMAANHDAVAEAAKKVGAITKEEAAALAAYRGEVNNASTAWQNFETRIAMAVMPALESAASKMAKWAANTENAATVANVFKTAIDTIGTLFIRLVEAGRMDIDVLMGIGTIGIDAFMGLSDTIRDYLIVQVTGLAAALLDLSQGQYKRAVLDLSAGFKAAGADISGSTARIKADFNNMVAYLGDDAKEATQKIQAMQDILSAPPKQAPTDPKGTIKPTFDFSQVSVDMDKALDKINEQATAGINKAWAQITASAAQSAKSQEEAGVGSIDRQIAAVQELGRTHQISGAQELAQETSLLNQKWAAEQAYYDKLKVIYQDNVEKLAEVNSQEEAAYQKHLNDMQKAQDAATTSMAKSWQKMGDQISNSFANAISGMLTKNRSFAQTVLSLGQSMVTGLINNFVKMGVAWVEQEIMKMIASRTAAAGVVAASAGAAGAAGTASFAAAPWPVDLGAAAFGASMAAVAGSFAVAEQGYDIPAGINPMVQAHGKEMILPPAESDVIRNAADRGGLGGGHFHMHMNGFDPQAMERMANNKSSVFHRALKSYYGRGGR